MGKNLTKTLKKYKVKIVTQLKDRLKSDGSKASGELIRSIKGEVTGETINIFASEYWYWVNYGRRPNKTPPPYRNILDWMKNKNIHQEQKESAQKRIAYFIAKKIGIQGFQGTRFVDFVNKNIIASLTKDVEQSYLEDINDQINGNKKT